MMIPRECEFEIDQHTGEYGSYVIYNCKQTINPVIISLGYKPPLVCTEMNLIFLSLKKRENSKSILIGTVMKPFQYGYSELLPYPPPPPPREPSKNPYEVE